MSRNKPLVHKPAGGTLDHAAEEAVALARKTDSTVTLEVNNVSVSVIGTDKPEDVIDAYWEARNKKAENYQNSPEGKAKAARRTAEIASNQRSIDVLVNNRLDSALKQGLTEVMKWIKEYTELANDSGVDWRGRAVFKALTAAGYRENDYTGVNFVKDNKEIMGRYVVGQLVNCLNSGRRPDEMLSTFADEYLRMPDRPSPGARIVPPKPSR